MNTIHLAVDNTKTKDRKDGSTLQPLKLTEQINREKTKTKDLSWDEVKEKYPDCYYRLSKDELKFLEENISNIGVGFIAHIMEFTSNPPVKVLNAQVRYNNLNEYLNAKYLKIKEARYLRKKEEEIRLSGNRKTKIPPYVPPTPEQLKKEYGAITKAAEIKREKMLDEFKSVISFLKNEKIAMDERFFRLEWYTLLDDTKKEAYENIKKEKVRDILQGIEPYVQTFLNKVSHKEVVDIPDFTVVDTIAKRLVKEMYDRLEKVKFFTKQRA